MLLASASVYCVTPRLLESNGGWEEECAKWKSAGALEASAGVGRLSPAASLCLAADLQLQLRGSRCELC